MSRYVPVELLEDRCYRSILEAEGAESERLSGAIDDALRQCFVETATWGLDIWERMLDLASYADKPYEHRRARIISKLRGMETITPSLVKNVAESFLNGTVTVNESGAGFTITFVDTRGIPPNMDDLKAAINDIKPAHLAVDYRFRYTTWGELAASATTWGELASSRLSWEQLTTWKVGE